MNTKILISTVLILITAFAVSAPYITVHQMKVAVRDGNGEELSEHIDFVVLRQSFKDQLNSNMQKKLMSDEMKDNPFAGLGMAFAGVFIDRMVDAYVTPSAISKMMSGSKPVDRNEDAGEVENEPFSNTSMSYESVSKFVVTVSGEGGNSRFIFWRNGLSWKLSEIIIPSE